MPTLENQTQFAARLGKDKAYVTRLKQAGRLVMVDGRVDVEASLALVEGTQGDRPQVAEYHARVREEKRAGGDPGASADMNLTRIDRAAAETRIAVAKADREEMERDKMAGNLIAREDVDFVLADLGATWRGLLENLPDRLSPVVYPLTTLEDTHAAVREMAEEMMHELAETLRQRGEIGRA